MHDTYIYVLEYNTAKHVYLENTSNTTPSPAQHRMRSVCICEVRRPKITNFLFNIGTKLDLVLQILHNRKSRM